MKNKKEIRQELSQLTVQYIEALKKLNELLNTLPVGLEEYQELKQKIDDAHNKFHEAFIAYTQSPKDCHQQSKL